MNVIGVNKIEEAEVRILVIAPHPDDELLSTGGVIQQHLESGHKVKVALMTNGDGQRLGPFLPNGHFIKLGIRRQHESIAALKHIGLPAENIYFLGYPDRGLAKLWNDYWGYEKLFKSKYTGRDRSPYKNSFTISAPYCGLAVFHDLQTIIKKERPDLIYLPHPSDVHSDHWATYVFTLCALEQLKAEDAAFKHLDERSLLTYLVHLGRWPWPNGLQLEQQLAVPRSLGANNTRWLTVTLTPQQTRKKYEAILKYRSQTKFIKEHLVSFARRNEVFGIVPQITVKSRTSKVESPVPTSWRLHPFTVHLSQTRGLLGVEIKRPSRPFSRRAPNGFRIHLKPLGIPELTNFSFALKKRQLFLNGARITDSELEWQSTRQSLHLSIPMELLAFPRKLLLGVELQRRSAYRLIEFF